MVLVHLTSILSSAFVLSLGGLGLGATLYNHERAVDVSFIPGNGISYFPAGYTAEAAFQTSLHQQFSTLFIISANHGSDNICIFGHATDLATGIGVQFNATGPGIHLAPYQTVQLGNLAPLRSKYGYNGILFGRKGCEENCDRCPGPPRAVFTLTEWTLDPVNDGKEGSLWTDLSLVDGLNKKMRLTVMKTSGVCSKTRTCERQFDEVKNICPPSNFWHDDQAQAWGCMSECSLTHTPAACAINTDPVASSKFLADLCPDAYAWALDDKLRNVVDGCPGREEPRGLIVELS